MKKIFLLAWCLVAVSGMATAKAQSSASTAGADDYILTYYEMDLAPSICGWKVSKQQMAFIDSRVVGEEQALGITFQQRQALVAEATQAIRSDPADYCSTSGVMYTAIQTDQQGDWPIVSPATPLPAQAPQVVQAPTAPPPTPVQQGCSDAALGC